MSPFISDRDWLSRLHEEYLAEFISAGGAAVKFVVTNAGGSTSVVNQVCNLAQQHGFPIIVIDAAKTKVHWVERVFFACAAQVPWEKLTDYVLNRFVCDEGFPVPQEIREECSYAAEVALQGGMDVDFVRQRLVSRVSTHVFNDRAMSRDFRLAMAWLCQNRLIGASTMQVDANLIKMWLTGDITRISDLRHVAIFTKINRTNARLHLESLLHWLRIAQIPGTVLIMNLDRLLQNRRVGDGEHYSRAALLDAYEVLRQFIDRVDDLEGLLLVVVADEAILDPDSRQRGLATYRALRNRVCDDVRDPTHQNPTASLVRLAPGGAL